MGFLSGILKVGFVEKYGLNRHKKLTKIILEGLPGLWILLGSSHCIQDIQWNHTIFWINFVSYGWNIPYNYCLFFWTMLICYLVLAGLFFKRMNDRITSLL